MWDLDEPREPFGGGGGGQVQRQIRVEDAGKYIVGGRGSLSECISTLVAGMARVVFDPGCDDWPGRGGGEVVKWGM